MDFVICAEMPKYEIGESTPIFYFMDVPGISLFVLRKHLEKFGLNNIDFKLARIKNRWDVYAIAIDLEKMEYDTVDESIEDICKRLNIENNYEVLGKTFNKLIEQSSYTF